MAVAVNQLDEKHQMVPPHIAEGRQPYAYAVTVGQVPGRVYWSDTFSEMVSLLTRLGDGYVTEPDGAVRLEGRARYAVGTQIQMQAFANTYAQVDSADWSHLCDWEKQVLSGRRTVEDQPHGFPTRHLLDGIDMWSAPVPLYVLSGTGHGEHIVLTDNDSLVVIDVFSDESLVRSLASAGYLQLWTATFEDGESH